MTTLSADLKNHPFFKDLPEKARRIILKSSEIKKFQPGEFVFREGQKAGNLFIVRKGQVALEVFSSQKGSVIIETIGEQDVLGWSWLIAPHRWRFDAIAQEPTELLVLNSNDVWKQCEENHELGFQLLKRFMGVITERLEATRLRLLDLYSSSDKGKERQ